jgi:membrane associated rhomboid family serine protease
MKSILRNFFWNHSPGVRWLMLVFGSSYLVAVAGGLTHLFNLYQWVGLSTEALGRGQIWRLLTCGLTPPGLLDWLFGLIWFSVLGGQLERLWSSRTFWCYCVLGILGGVLPLLLILPAGITVVVGSAPATFGLLAAWYRLCGHERLLLHGLGPVSVRQAAIVIAALNAAIVYVGNGWKVTLCLMGGALAVWLGLSIHRRWNILRLQHSTGPSRINRLEV